MFDERWSDDADDIGAGLAAVLASECTAATVRAAEEAADGRDRRLESALDDFGIWELPGDPAVLARVALELGRALAPVPFVEVATVRAVLGHESTSYGLEGPVPASVPHVAVAHPDGVAVVSHDAPPRRSAAGDLLVAPPTGEGAEPVADHDGAARLWALTRLLDSARLVGASRMLLDLGVAYAGERVQFGRPIGSFQGVAYRLVDAAIAIDAAELLVRKSAWLAGPELAPPPLFATMTRAKAVEAARLVATNVHQVMGGYGFAMEYDCQLASRRLRSWTQRLRPVGSDLRDVARTLLDPARRQQVEHLWHHDRGVPVPRWAREADTAATRASG